MKRSAIRKFAALSIILPVFLAASAAANAASIHKPSAWAAKGIDICRKVEITTENFDNKSYTESITRLDFCELLINTCQINDIALPPRPENHPFTDTADANAEYAYMLGLTTGTADGVFSPELPLSREMAAAMLSRLRVLFQAKLDNIDLSNITEISENKPGNIYRTPEGIFAYTPPMSDEEASGFLKNYATDNNDVSGWAKSYMADVYSRGILSGTGGGKLDPASEILREQAAILSLNLLAYYNTAPFTDAGIEQAFIPKPTGIFINQTYEQDKLYLRWNDIPTAEAYDIEIRKDGVTVYTERITSNFIDLRNSSQPSRSGDRETSLYNKVFGTGKGAIEAVLKVTPIDGNGVPSMNSLVQAFDIKGSYKNLNELITGDPNKNQFANESEALKHMTDITVNVWKLTSSGTKEPSSITFKINKNVASTVRSIFEDIYNGKEKFPIKSIVGYAYRDGKSQHSNGTAVDINYEENYFISSSGSILAGKLWKPGSNPYSIPPKGDVVKAFNSYGWHWSPDMNWPNGKDYMHFSLVGK